ncbi:MAG: ArnT family glycosyltransferase [Candidatus Sumerlaeia bacterium]
MNSLYATPYNPRLPRALVLIVLVACMATFSGHIYSPDEEILFRTTEALATRASTAIEPILGFATSPPPGGRKDGREYAQYGIGQPLVAIPFYYLGRGLGELFSAKAWVALRMRLQTNHPVPYADVRGGIDMEVLARDTASRFGISLFNIAVTVAGAWVLFLLVQRLTGDEKAAFWGVLAGMLGSVLWPHSRTFFTETFAGFCLLISLYCLHRSLDEKSWRWTLGAGIAAGYAVLVRMDSLVFMPVMGLLALYADYLPLASICRTKDRIRDAWQHATYKPSIQRAAIFTIPVLAACAIILLINRVQFGGFFESGYQDQTEGIQFSTPILVGLYGFFLSIGKGLFFFSPVLVLAIFGLRPMLKREPVWGWAMIGLCAIFLAVMSKWRNWPGGWCWGPRHIIQIHWLMIVPLVFWLAQGITRSRRLVLIVLVLIGGAVQLYGASQNFIQYYQIFYRDPTPPSATALYDMQTNQALQQQYALYRRDPQTGRPTTEMPLNQLPAPVNDSIYIVQNSQWTGYAVMWRLGVHDVFWLHLIRE